MYKLIIGIFLLFFAYEASIAQDNNFNHALLSARSSNLPAGYYANAEGKSCAPLKTALFNIISANNTSLLYADVIPAHTRTDKRRNDANTADIVWDIYSDNPSGPEPYSFTFITDRCGQYSVEGDCYNREHLFPQSWFNDELPMLADLNHVFPTDGAVNGLRGNTPFGEVSNASKTTRNGSKLGTGSNFGYSGTFFEPIDEYKGDVARAILYMSVRYESQIGGWIKNSNAEDILNGTSYPSFQNWHLKLLYKWHLQDPVSDKERKRNDSVFVILKNRNPFIDNPDWVFKIWSCTGLINSTPVNEIDMPNEHSFRVYPNPVTGSKIILSFNRPLSQNTYCEIFDFQGRKFFEQTFNPNGTQYEINSGKLKPGVYYLRVNTQVYSPVYKLIVSGL